MAFQSDPSGKDGAAKPRLLLATHNPGKARELAVLFRDSAYQLVTLDELEITEEIEETGSSYLENARFKAAGYARLSGLLTLADDSGIEAEALDGAPGLHSARYGGPDLDDAGHNALLRSEIESSGRPERGLAFRCVVVIADPGGELAHFEGVVRGVLADRAAGDNGFGYDPIFYLSDRGCTTAELPSEEKNRISHRGKAVAAAADWLGRRSGDERPEAPLGRES